MTLRDILSKEWFEKIESVFSSRYGMPLESSNPDGKRIGSLSSIPCYPYFCRLIHDSRPAIARCHRDRVQWLDLAFKNGKPYIGTCHAGLVLACVPVIYRGISLGGIFFGKCMLHQADNRSRQELHRRFKGFAFYWSDFYTAMDKIQVVSQRQLVRGGKYLQSQLKQVLVPQKVTVLRKQKAQKLAKKAHKHEQHNKTLPQMDPASRLGPAIELMDYHYDLPLKLKDIAKFAGLSKFRFAHLFRDKMGVTPVEYLTRVRIGHAKRLLVKSDWNTRQIMESIGYTYQSYYIRMFKRVTGMTPEQFRLSKRGRIQHSKLKRKKRIIQ